MYNSTKQFYKSDAWEKLRKVCIDNWIESDGFVHCSVCHEPIVKPYDLIVHHITELTDLNVNDATVALNPDNLTPVHFRCHNKIHERFTVGAKAPDKVEQHVYVIYGAPCSGKSSYVKSIADSDDVVVDLDNIYEMISNNKRYDRGGGAALKNFAFQIQTYIYTLLRSRSGHWKNAYVITSCPRVGDRRTLRRRVGADDFILIESDIDTCLARAKDRPPEWAGYIRDWFDRYESGE